MSIKEKVAQGLNLTGNTDAEGNELTLCPFHEDTRNSFSINLKKGVGHCFACNEGWKLKEILARIEEKEQEEEETVEEDETLILTSLPTDLLEKAAAEILGERKVKIPKTMSYLVDVDNSSPMYGYMVFSSTFGEQKVGKLVVPLLESKTHPRYKNLRGSKELFWVTLPEKDSKTVWVTEGLFDALSLHTIGIRGVAASLGSGLSPQQAYSLRHYNVIICYDSDYAGWNGGKKAVEALNDVGGNGVSLEFPESLGKDLNEALINNVKKLKEWVHNSLHQFKPSDTRYVEQMLSNPGSVLTISTGIPEWDKLLSGGFRPGLHVIGAAPGQGKSALVVWWLVTQAAAAGLKCLFVTNEIPKLQCWARVASIKDPAPWSNIEVNPLILKEKTKAWLLDLSSRIRIVAGWDVNKIAYAAPEYDVIIVDYLQRIPGVSFGDNKRLAIDSQVEKLANLARDLGKIIIGVSSLNRGAYADPGVSGFKETGGIEYIAQSATVFAKSFDGTIAATVVKSTRGINGSFFMEANLAHQKFTPLRGNKLNVPDDIKDKFRWS